MSKDNPFNPGRLGAMALHVAGAWIALAALIYVATWEPIEPLAQSGRVVLLIVAGVALLWCVIAATSRLLSSAAASVPDPDPKP